MVASRYQNLDDRIDVEAARRDGLTAHLLAPVLGTWSRAARDAAVPWATATLVLLAGAAIFAPVLIPGDPTRIDLTRALTPPCQAHLLGTDSLGRDVLQMALSGARVSLSVGVSAAALSAVFGLALGLLAAERGGVIDAIVGRLVDAALAVPAFFIVVACQAILGPGLVNVVVVVSAVSWMTTTRVVRALANGLNEREFVLAARSLGCSSARIALRHVLPNLAPQAVVLFTLGIADALLMESALSFLGLGVPPTEPSWGNMLNGAQMGLLSGAWWVAAVPGLLILLTALCVNLLGDGLSTASASDLLSR